jgi:hypothetical protein
MAIDKKAAAWLQNGVTLPAFLAVQLFLPISTVVSTSLNLHQFIAIFFIPAALGVLRASLGIIKNPPFLIEALWAVSGGVLIGAFTGFGFLSIVVLYHWQLNPGNSHLEPLFAALGLAAASAEAARRFSVHDDAVESHEEG